VKDFHDINIPYEDTKSGALVLAYAHECSVKGAERAVGRYLDHLRAHGIESEEVIVQTDRGAEFSGTRRKLDGGFPYHVEQVYGATHWFIPPRLSNVNADVESSHALIEHEFYDLERFRDREDFLSKASMYQYYFNSSSTPRELKFCKNGRLRLSKPGLAP